MQKPDVPEKLKVRVEDVILNRSTEATDRLLEIAEKYKKGVNTERTADMSWRGKDVNARLAHALINGITDFIDEDTE